MKKKMIKTATCWFHIFLTLHTCYDWDSYISAAPRAQLWLPGHFYSRISRVIIIFLFHRILLSLHLRYVYVMQCPPVLIRFLNAFLANKNHMWNVSIWKNVMKTSALMLISDINVSYCSSVEIKSHPDKAIKLIKNIVFILSLKLTHLRSHQHGG